MKLNDFLLLGNNMIIPREHWNADTKVEQTGLPHENVCHLDENVFVSTLEFRIYVKFCINSRVWYVRVVIETSFTVF